MQILRKINFKNLEKAKKLSPLKLIQKIKKSGLMGRGGANFSIGKKFQMTNPAKYLICNADESEPGRFKDRFILENNPELVIEGIYIAMYALSAKKCFIYLREEYKEFKDKLQKIINERNEFDIDIVIGAGSYICGEETAILNSIEGKRTESRQKPPYPSQFGLYGKKTCVNNIETLTRLPLIFEHDFDKDLLLFSLSGDIAKPGVYEEKQGITIGSIAKKYKATNTKAIFFCASGGVIPFNKNQILSYEEIEKTGAYFETGIIFLNKSRSIPDISRSIIQFFNDENCGKCLPCREGNFRLLQLFQVILKRKWRKEEFEMIKDLVDFIPNGSQCALGKSSTIHLKTAIKYFENEFQELTN
ncbi:MAG: NADH-ubiquinone oxidoreductase-F iron-sulfur binding region domain-containing protein [Patescibacteria group bacterium]|nr:NADH-ubiquinone oxidoreductase-F iron-sulfur binding region domain-containing protein [Patescibacteria group bacterium]MDD4304284.1 NADH-ubiquinone oxidoreductase-F iron-sulfur binding region domain-containing protein [Patescibacteria group bacterium]MDD4695689.1 NADH-ubiquinone oxidoreductase-F iron-sulfur binding region domain-containing protein [Patescibacteria group bacterium]